MAWKAQAGKASDSAPPMLIIAANMSRCITRTLLVHTSAGGSSVLHHSVGVVGEHE
jgi:hypothetical protein